MATRAKAPAAAPLNAPALLRWQGRDGNWLTAVAKSASRPGVWHRVRVHLVTDAANCTCSGYTSHKHCWHVEAAREGAWRYNDTLEVMRTTLDDAWLALEVECLAPSQIGGVVALAWLAAKRVQAERTPTHEAA